MQAIIPNLVLLAAALASRHEQEPEHLTPVMVEGQPVHIPDGATWRPGEMRLYAVLETTAVVGHHEHPARFVVRMEQVKVPLDAGWRPRRRMAWFGSTLMAASADRGRDRVNREKRRRMQATNADAMSEIRAQEGG